MNLSESLKQLEDKAFINEDKVLNLRALYEEARLSAQDKAELKRLLTSTDDPNMVNAFLQTKEAEKNESLFDEEDECVLCYGLNEFQCETEVFDDAKDAHKRFLEVKGKYPYCNLSCDFGEELQDNDRLDEGRVGNFLKKAANAVDDFMFDKEDIVKFDFSEEMPKLIEVANNYADYDEAIDACIDYLAENDREVQELLTRTSGKSLKDISDEDSQLIDSLLDGVEKAVKKSKVRSNERKEFFKGAKDKLANAIFEPEDESLCEDFDEEPGGAHISDEQLFGEEDIEESFGWPMGLDDADPEDRERYLQSLRDRAKEVNRDGELPFFDEEPEEKELP